VFSWPFSIYEWHERSLVAIEEPEIALHPAAAEVLRDSLRAATRTTQLLVTVTALICWMIQRLIQRVCCCGSGRWCDDYRGGRFIRS